MSRGIRALILILSPLAPAARRRAWIEQWIAELWHYDAWLQSDGGCHWRALKLAARATGAIPHAVTLRVLDWRPRMLGHDFKFAWRMFVRRPGFTAVGVAILALGIGANATIMSWIEGVLLNPLPGVTAQDRLVAIRGVSRTRDALAVSYPDFVDLRAAGAQGLADVTAFRIVAMNVRTTADPMRVYGELVTPNFLRVLGVRPALGRDLREDEGQTPGRAPVVIVSHAFWRRALDSDPSVVGRTITINTLPFTVVGVTPPEFRGSAAGLALDLFVPMTMQKVMIAGDRLGDRGTAWLQVYGRVRPEATLEQVRTGLKVVGDRLAATYRDTNDGRTLQGAPLSRDGASGLLMPVITVLMAVVGLVLLIACANLAGLLLARAAGRQREVAVRFAVGASRPRLVRQLLIENLMVAVAGGCAGVLLARWTSGLLSMFVPPTPYPIGFHPALSVRVVAASMLLTIVTAILSGLLPAWRGSRADIGVALKESAPTTAAGGRGRLRQGLVIAQVALSLLLLVCAALFLRSLSRAQAIDTGYSARQGLIASIDLLAGGYDRDRGIVFYQQALSRIRAIPGVERASVATALPLDLGSGSDMNVSVEGYTPRQDEPMHAYYNRVAPDYFETLGIAIVQGRAITARDTADMPQVAVINETMARQYFRGRSAIGGRLRFGSGPVTIVGVARDGKYAQLNEPPRSYLYLPILQNYRPEGVLLVRTADPGSVLPAIQRELRALDPALPLFDVRTIAEHRRVSLFLPAMASTLLGVFGVLAVLLAAVGLYGVVAYAVSQRTKEIGVRVALGATRGDIVAMIVRQGFVITCAGIGIGVGLALLLAGVLRAQLVGVSPRDPVAFIGAPVCVVLLAVLACALPARRAAGLDPLRALRQP